MSLMCRLCFSPRWPPKLKSKRLFVFEGDHHASSIHQDNETLKRGSWRNDFAWFFHGSFFLPESVTLRSNQLTLEGDAEPILFILQTFQLIACNIQLDTHLEGEKDWSKWFWNDPLITIMISMTLFKITLNSIEKTMVFDGNWIWQKIWSAAPIFP